MVILLMIANWSLEARKWQIALRKVQQIPFFRAFREWEGMTPGEWKATNKGV